MVVIYAAAEGPSQLAVWIAQIRVFNIVATISQQILFVNAILIYRSFLGLYAMWRYVCNKLSVYR